MKISLPDPIILRRILRYEPETGNLYWLHRGRELFPSDWSCEMWNYRYAGKRAMTCLSKGYHSGPLLGCTTMHAHRVIYALVYGEWPTKQVDHINGIRNDNRLINLRLVTPTENAQNTFKMKNNTSGVTGVYLRKESNRWSAKIGSKSRLINIGTFDTFEQAVSARIKAQRDLGYSPRHGADFNKIKSARR